MGKMAQLWNLFRKQASPSVEKSVPDNPHVMFDERFKTVIKCEYSTDYPEMLFWLDQNTQNLVQVKFDDSYGNESFYVGFESPDDALVFKIRYSV